MCAVAEPIGTPYLTILSSSPMPQRAILWPSEIVIASVTATPSTTMVSPAATLPRATSTLSALESSRSRESLCSGLAFARHPRH